LTQETTPLPKSKRTKILVMRGFQLRYVGLVAGSLLVLLVIAGAHTLYLGRSLFLDEASRQYEPLIQASMFRFFIVGFFYVVVVTLAAVFLSHRAVGPTRRIEEELNDIVENKSNGHLLKIREGDDFEGLVKSINRVLEKSLHLHRK
jgi:hypothetical protein